MSVPIAFMAYFGDPEWYNKHVYPLKDAFVKPEKADVVGGCSHDGRNFALTDAGI